MAASSSNHVLFFGDHMSDPVSLIRNLVHISKQSPAVRRLLDEATDVLQLELSRLSRLDHGWDKTFDSLLEMAEANATSTAGESDGGEKNGILTCALFCISRLGELVAHAEREPSILGNFDASSSSSSSSSQPPVEVVGLCMGLLPATVALAARDSSQIFTLAREMIKVSVRMGFSVWYRMRLIDASPGSWSQTFVHVSAEDATSILERFHEQCRIPIVRRIAVGVTSKNFITLFGAPSTLARLLAWPGAGPLADATRIPTEAGGCVHTLYMPDLDISGILSGLSRDILEWPLAPIERSRMSSPDRLAYYEHETLGGLLADVMQDIAHKPLRLDETLERCVSQLSASGREHVKLFVMGQNGHVAAMTSALKNAGITSNVVTNTTTTTTPSAPSSSMGSSLPTPPDHERPAGELLSNRGQSGLIAIVGMSGRFPDNDTVEGFWEDLIDGTTHIREVPPDRFNVQSWFDPSLETKNSTTATKGAWLANPGLFDHRLFNISPREAAQMDPIHRNFLTCSYEALQHAGYNPGASLSMDGSNVSTFFGQLGEDWHDIIHERGADIYYVPGIARTFAPSRVNYHYKFGGGSYAVDSACASSITTIHLACQALTSRSCDMALAGGGSMMYTPVPFSGLSRSGMISSTDGCRTFHDDADGYARGEGIGVVVLKRLEDALADNDNILGVIRGSARTFSTTTTSITHPSHESQERVYKRVLAQSGLDASEIAYVEMHGTGTQAGDYEEMTSVINVLAPPGSRSSHNPLTLGTVKAAVGHGEAAAGVTALIKLLLMFRHKIIPGQPGWPFKINHRFPPLGPLNIRIATAPVTLKPSPKGDKRVKVMLNSFDASGGESCLAIEEAPPHNIQEDDDDQADDAAAARDPRTAHVVTLSARTTASLAGNRRRLLSWLELHPNVGLASVAYTTTARRMHEPLREAYAVKSVAELLQQLQDADDARGGDTTPKAKPKPAGRVFLFTGQGSQYSQMGSVLFNTHETFRTKLLGYQEMATRMGMPRFVQVITEPDYVEKGATTTQIQLAIVALEIAMAETLAQYGVVPTAVMGHSLGEYAALCVAGVLSVSDVLYLVGERAMRMEEHLTPQTHAMLATTFAADELEAQYTSLGLASCNIACKNAAASTVASGTVEDIARLQEHLAARGSRTKLLNVPYGFHSQQVEPILDHFTSIASGVVFRAPDVPVVSSYLGKVVSAGDGTVFSPEYLARQCRGTVDFVGAVRAAEAAEAASINKTLWIEMGPEPVLLGLVRWTLPTLPPANLVAAFKASPLEDNWATLSEVLKAAYQSGLDVNWPEFHRNFTKHVRLLELPFYAFDFKNFWHEPFPHPDLSVVQKMGAATVHGHQADAAAAPPPCKCSCACSQDMLRPGSTNASSARLPSFPGFPSTSVPTVESEDYEDGGNTLMATFSADTSEPNLLRAIEGHVVHGHVICPMSVLVDMALTTAKYCLFRLQGISDTPCLSVTNISMTHALILQQTDASSRKPLIHVKAVMRKGDNSVDITFVWVKFKPGKPDTREEEETGGTCRVTFERDETWPASIHRSLFLVKSRVEALRAASRDGRAHRLLKPVVYRMFSESVDYSEPFRGIDEVVLDVDCKDAISKVTLTPDASSGSFVMNPFWTDALTHLGGFILNSGLRYVQQDMLCMARGFDSWRVVGAGSPMRPGMTYTTYTFMQDVEGGNLVVGDCYIFDEDDNLVQTLLGLEFQKLKRVVMDAVFGQRPSPHAAVPAVVVNKHATHQQQQQQQQQILPAKQKLPQPSTSSVSSVGVDTPASETPPSSSQHSASTAPSEADDDARELLNTILSIVAQEAGCKPEDLVDEAVFADLGIDSLMGISILAVITRKTGIDLDSTFFIQHETLGDARNALEEILGVSHLPREEDLSPAVTVSPDIATTQGRPTLVRRDDNIPSQPSDSRALFKRHQEALPVLADAAATADKDSTPKDPAVSPGLISAALDHDVKITHLSGPKTKATTKLFLLADETGTSLSCIQLPAVTSLNGGNTLSVWGAESPFGAQPDLWTGRSIRDVAVMNLRSIQKHHQTDAQAGPLLLGGVGAGAAMAIEVARLAVSENPIISVGLVLLDPSPTRQDIETTLAVPGVRLKPAQRHHAAKMAEAIDELQMEPLRSKNVRAIAIFPDLATASSSQLLKRLLPDVQIKTVGTSLSKGTLMRFPAIGNTGAIYLECVRDLAA
ncbi:Putative Acyl transferase domain superfamily, phosphopantetheine binding ACP domain, thiolase [Colletotrichum destructivum]|uniref:Acyl transferase domain superfamily, phosphopantetheine binding ACP domain, thiolase n=1 Tax=Colletotrichum destructivum TaxID=34406 RepID=A0AAX4J439_9PEZI|nr:Putative Acyl transferase domain superfamily, phosphopantetheine binding ACP domain, thiolase [Colletotrichum destructivum]